VDSDALSRRFFLLFFPKSDPFFYDDSLLVHSFGPATFCLTPFFVGPPLSLVLAVCTVSTHPIPTSPTRRFFPLSLLFFLPSKNPVGVSGTPRPLSFVVWLCAADPNASSFCYEPLPRKCGPCHFLCFPLVQNSSPVTSFPFRCFMRSAEFLPFSFLLRPSNPVWAFRFFLRFWRFAKTHVLEKKPSGAPARFFFLLIFSFYFSFARALQQYRLEVVPVSPFPPTSPTVFPFFIFFFHSHGSLGQRLCYVRGPIGHIPPFCSPPGDAGSVLPAFSLFLFFTVNASPRFDACLAPKVLGRSFDAVLDPCFFFSPHLPPLTGATGNVGIPPCLFYGLSNCPSSPFSAPPLHRRTPDVDSPNFFPPSCPCFAFCFRVPAQVVRFFLPFRRVFFALELALHPCCFFHQLRRHFLFLSPVHSITFFFLPPTPPNGLFSFKRPPTLPFAQLFVEHLPRSMRPWS